MFSSTFFISDLETESKPASMSVCIMHFLMSRRSVGFGIKMMVRSFTAVSKLLPDNICSLIALRMRFGQIFENHSKSLDDIPSGPPQLILLSLDIAFLSSAILIGKLSFCLTRFESSLPFFSSSCVGKKWLTFAVENGTWFVLSFL